VAEAAKAALDEAAIRPDERELDFGEVAVGADVGVRMVRLLGPPLARACVAQAVENWISVADTAEGITVSVDTSRAGAHHGSLVVKGSTGEAVIPVDVHVTAPATVPLSSRPPVASGAPIAASELAAAPKLEPAAPVAAAPLPAAAAPAPQPLAGHTVTPAGGPAGPSLTERRSPWPGLVAVALLLAGGLTILLGIVLPTINGDQDKIRTITIQIAVYAGSWTLLTCAPGEATRGRRIILGAVAAWALVVVIWLASDLPYYMAYWEIRDTPLHLFWLPAGVLEIGAAVLGRSRPTRRLELVAGGLAAGLGLLILYLVNQESATAWLVGSFSVYFIAVGVTWVLIGLIRRRATRTG
jgi:hypothetical protein